MKAVLFGATKGMGRALARCMAERGDELFLAGRNAEDLEKSARDLEVRSGGRIQVGTHAGFDLESPDTIPTALDAADAALDGFDTVVITAGIYATQEVLEEDPGLVAKMLDVNFGHTVLLCEEARKRLMARGGGTLCVFSSVAGDRGRKPVAIYGATKAGLSHYLESLDHKFRDQGLVTVCVKPGFVKTGMTEGLKPPPFAGEPDKVAARVLAAIDKGKPLVYAPAPWWAVMTVIKLMPRFVMRKVGF